MAPDREADDEGTIPVTSNVPWEEFKVIQDKIDRISDFRFRVRGWVVALVTGLLLAAVSEKIPVPAFAYLFAMLPLALFHVMEARQDAWHAALSSRAIRLERKLRGKEGFSPRLASTLLGKRRELKQTRWGRVLLYERQIF